MPRRRKSGTIRAKATDSSDKTEVEEPIGQYRRGAYDDDDNETDDESDASSNVIPSRTEAAPTKMKKAKKRYTNNDGEEWKNSQQKKDIIAAFLEEGSGIHKLTNAQIYEKYASNVGWEKKNATDNIRRLKNQYLDKEGPFSEKELNQVEPFRTRKGIKSKAYSLLLKAHVHSDQSGINRMGWVRGPKPAGSESDITMFRGGNEEDGQENWDKEALYFKIPDGKLVITDSGYKGEPNKIMMATDEMTKEMKGYIGRAKARQETFNGRLKGTFNIRGHRFRHNQKSAEETMKLHQSVVHACAVLIQYDYENGHPPFPLHH